MRVLEKDRLTLTDIIGALEGLPHGNERESIRSWRDSEIVWDIHAREAYSYGRHFPLFRMLEAPGKRGRPARYVLNGERWSGTGSWGNRSRTPDHQTMVRELTAGAQTLILPFGALTGAGIDISSIRALDVSEDRWVTLERTARTLEEMPRHEREESYTVERTARYLDDAALEQAREQGRYEAPTADIATLVPARYRTEYRPLTEEEREERTARDEYAPTYGPMPIETGADGLYRWTESRKRPVQPGPDGLYRWTEERHNLGESVFSAVREESETRAARAFEAPSASSRRTVTLAGRRADSDVWSEHCDGSADTGAHESGPGASCAHCGAELRATVVTRRRAVFLSGFDTNENPALYFLCQLPRGAGRTVETARDSLAPRAVHAALAREIEVRRQGDVFLVDTDLTREELEARGASFARLTLWTRDAKPRAGEPDFVPTVPAAVRRRRAARELSYARKLWRESFEDWTRRALYSETLEQARHEAIEQAREDWRELTSRHRYELEQARERGVDIGACSHCGAPVGVPCTPLPDREDIPANLRGRHCYGADRRRPVADIHESERRELARKLERKPISYLAPASGAKDRTRARGARERAFDNLEARRVALRSALFAGYERERWAHRRAPSMAEERSQLVRRLDSARANYDSALELYRRRLVSGDRQESRDEYRKRPGAHCALELWRRALEQAREKYRPETVFDSGAFRARRERTRRACSIYGTAHTATEVARVRGTVYVRGTVSHVPALELGRFGVPDHRPLTLTPDRWYIAVRNTVPRARRAS